MKINNMYICKKGRRVGGRFSEYIGGRMLRLQVTGRSLRERPQRWFKDVNISSPPTPPIKLINDRLVADVQKQKRPLRLQQL